MIKKIPSSECTHFVRLRTFQKSIKNGKVKIKKIITSDYIIDETLTRIRYAVGHREAVERGKEVLASKVVEKLEVGREIFEFAWELFETYEDKRLSFTDCTSFAIMKKRGVERAFSFDRDFEKMGFIPLP